ncbi:hypothetical protein DEI99_006775 [Curtobacterium sp. MCLR17_036]|uniref:hypothetical protein n=1 Tax=Curtobacterium sp. MCLR17_036 TaxID=2175620 RepID=UPI001C64E619|nr:hypothetical protein [Curtobacterium sp. MCLR17_036]WIE66590.1 hypothetical protein DEI99_006775 [Curtobacterium sp. MCLR17_036]
MVDARSASLMAGPDPVGSVPAAPGQEARHPLGGGRRVVDVVASTVLLAVLTLGSLVAAWGIVFMRLAFSSCAAPGNSCNEALGGTAVFIGPVLVALVAVVAIVVTVVRLVRRRWAWPVPLVAIVAVVAVFAVVQLLVGSSVTRGF